LIFDTKYFPVFSHVPLYLACMYLYLKYDVYFCVFRSVKPILHDSKCEKLVPKNGREQWNKLQRIKVRKILNTTYLKSSLQSVYLFRLLGVLV
jgi:hypothetical protein